MKRAERTVYALFYLSIVGSICAVAAYMLFPIEPGDLEIRRLNNLFLGLGIALALLGIGIGAIHWSKALMADHDIVEHAPRDARHATRRAQTAVEVFDARQRGVRLRRAAR